MVMKDDEKRYENSYKVEMISIEDLAPKEHLLREISSAVDFSKIYEFEKDCKMEMEGAIIPLPKYLFFY